MLSKANPLKPVRLQASIRDARVLVDRWTTHRRPFELLIDYTPFGVSLALQQANVLVDITTIQGNKKYFTNARSMHHWLASLFPNGNCLCPISSHYQSATEWD